jgi:DNA-directed RNA polymerase subunit RPC12/RpoP
MAFTVEHQCPQCGAPIELEETDYLLRCPYCNVKNFLFAPGCFHFLLPHKAFDKDIIYAPYMRFKGEVYFCKGTSIGHRIVDITHLGAAFKELPVSLGLRPQAMKMKFVTPDTVGSFLKCSLRAADVLAKVGRQSLIFGPGKLIHRAYIGEALSLIYLPLFVQNNRVFDGVTERLIAKVPQGVEIFDPAIEENPRWKITFMATICPRCGWNLDGERDSVVLTCSNCDAAWEASEGTFIQVGFGTVPARGEHSVYLPFWKITATDKALQINFYADFIRVTNQPRAVQKHWENQAMAFWIPAFKIRPKVFLNLARQMTITQKDFEMEEKIPKKGLYPVTLPQGEAAQGMKITLASAGLSKKKIFPLLPRVSFTTKESTLVYLPFNDTGHEMIQEHMGISINKNALRFGRQL